MISLVVPVYNVKGYIGKCVDSIMAQSVTEWECILVDDGSTDGSGAICDAYAKKDERIRVMHKENGGLSSARNAGIEISQGEYIAFIDGDDYIHYQYLEMLLLAMEQVDADMSVCAFEKVGGTYQGLDTSSKREFKCQVYSGEEAFCKRWTIYVMAWNKLYKRKLFDKCRYPNGKLHEDEYVYHEILYQCERVAYIDQPLYFYVCRGDSIVSSFNLFRMTCAMEALEYRLDFCVANEWGNTPYYAMEAIFEYAVNWYYFLKEDREYKGNEKTILKWVRNLVRKYKDVDIALSYRMFAVLPSVYNVVSKIREKR